MSYLNYALSNCICQLCPPPPHTHTHKQVKKAYGPNTDNIHTQEELARMREYAMKEIDRNRDTQITLDEFMSYVHGDRFDDKEEWKAVVDEEEVVYLQHRHSEKVKNSLPLQAFTEEEMHKFEEDYYDDYYDYEYDDKGNIIGFKEKTVPPSEHPTPVSHQPSGRSICGLYSIQ